MKNKFHLITWAVCNCRDSLLFVCFLVALWKVTVVSLVSFLFTRSRYITIFWFIIHPPGVTWRILIKLLRVHGVFVVATLQQTTFWFIPSIEKSDGCTWRILIKLLRVYGVFFIKVSLRVHGILFIFCFQWYICLMQNSRSIVNVKCHTKLFCYQIVSRIQFTILLYLGVRERKEVI